MCPLSSFSSPNVYEMCENFRPARRKEEGEGLGDDIEEWKWEGESVIFENDNIFDLTGVLFIFYWCGMSCGLHLTICWKNNIKAFSFLLPNTTGLNLGYLMCE